VAKPLIEIRGLRGVASYFREFPKLSEQAARLASNEGARFAARLGSKEIRSQVAFSRSYMGAAGAQGSKLRIKQFASSGNLEAVVAAQDRPVSLARFATGTPTFGRRPKNARAPRVRVKTGGGLAQVKRGFFVRLRRGAIVTADEFNVGLAVRLKPGESLQATTRASPLGGGAYLLYGPSVAQAFDTVRDDISGQVADFTAFEFARQFRRLSRG
jgi:hypothetical protein